MAGNSKRQGIVAGAVSALLAATVGLGSLANREAARVVTGAPYEIPATQEIRYRVADRPAQGMPGVLRYARKRLERPAHRGQGYQLRRTNVDMAWSKPKPLNLALDRYRERLENGPVNAQWVIRAKKDGYRLYTLKVDLNPAKIANTEGTQAVDIIIGTLMARYGSSLRIGGVYVCRTIAGSYTLSQHAYANAVDVFGSTSTMSSAAYWMLDLARKDYVPVSQILWNYRNLFTGNYVYDHTDHVHFSGEPLLSGGCRKP